MYKYRHESESKVLRSYAQALEVPKFIKVSVALGALLGVILFLILAFDMVKQRWEPWSPFWEELPFKVMLMGAFFLFFSMLLSTARKWAAGRVFSLGAGFGLLFLGGGYFLALPFFMTVNTYFDTSPAQSISAQIIKKIATEHEGSRGGKYVVKSWLVKVAPEKELRKINVPDHWSEQTESGDKLIINVRGGLFGISYIDAIQKVQ
ncbi:hypothetical protein [Undibacterium sp. TS12]|uniref:hypothetical protein n=1 Tax=Undibacterium sp. TS12 TaxID=2908202 RepID=UPI001F4C9F11|nr:hypothetical protein [Undibacterium sp. TS12]MCH8620658.1 hypothetical protein [Undibacterium sp. TS12]